MRAQLDAIATPRIAIVGSGPSGCYTAQFLRKEWNQAQIVIFDRLMEPYGLIRYGVAPDHLGTKGIAKQFDRLFTHDRVEFRGGVEIGSTISIESLRESFDIVVLATGLWGDRTLECFRPALESGLGDRIYGSGRLTRMINGFPGIDASQVRLGRRTTIIGNGNVAIDLVRLILSTPDALSQAGVSEEAIAALRADGPVERIDVVGRSGAPGAKFDAAMVRELGRLPDVSFRAEISDRDFSEAENEARGRLNALSEIVALPDSGQREVVFHFGWSPERIEGERGLERVIFADTSGHREDLAIDADSICTAVGFTEVTDDALLRRDLETESTDIDAGVLGDGLYCVGWLRRGPIGTIPVNRNDAKHVAERIIADFEASASMAETQMEEPDLERDRTSSDQKEAPEDQGATSEVTVIYGTESGNAETIAEVFVDEWSDELTIRKIDMSDVTISDLCRADVVLALCSTHGEGAMPSSAVPLAQLLDAERPDLSKLRYAMFGLGDSSYEFYSRGSEHIVQRLDDLGASRIGEYGRHDAADGSLPNSRALKWARAVLAESIGIEDSSYIDSDEAEAERTAGITTAVRTDLSVVPPNLTLHYDPFSYADYDAPYELFRRLRNEAPVYHNPDLDIYFISRYADVRAVLADTKRFSSRFGNDIDGTHDSFGKGFLVTLDPPRHTALRAAIRRTFSVKEILSKEDGVREYVRSLLEPFWKQGGGDFTAEVGLPTGVGMAVMLLGRPLSDVPAFVDHIERELVRVVGAPGVPEDATAAVEETEEMIAERFAARRAEIDAGIDADASDAMTQITLSVHAGKVMPDEQVGLAHLVLAAASDAPAAFLSQIVMVLDRFPAMQPFLGEHPDQIPAFIEECLRYDTPAQNASRQTTEDVEIAGTVIPANSRVTLLQGSANRDERVFTDPDVFDITRTVTPANRIMSFGEGPHACMGAPFLRLSARVLVEELVKGPPISIVGLPERFSKQLIRGFAKLPVKVA